MLLQHAFASGVNDPRGCPDLGIAIGVDVVHQEIDQPTFFLEHRQEVDDFGVHTARFRLCRYRASRFGRGLWRGRLLAWLEEHQDQNQNGQRQCGCRKGSAW